MIFAAPTSFTDALEHQAVKTVLPTTGSAADIAKLPVAIRQRAILSARTTSARHLSAIDQVITRIIDPDFVDGRPRKPGEHMNPADARQLLRQSLSDIGYQPSDIGATPGSLKDLSSTSRLDLIIDTNVKMARGYGTWKQGQSEAILDQWPAQELVRHESREVPRTWLDRWRTAGGTLHGGRMIALKNDPIWITISTFGLPYPPFDYNSGMGLDDVDRDTAVDLGLIDQDTQIPPEDADLNDNFQIPSPVDPNEQPALHQSLMESMGDDVRFNDGILEFA